MQVNRQILAFGGSTAGQHQDRPQRPVGPFCVLHGRLPERPGKTTTAARIFFATYNPGDGFGSQCGNHAALREWQGGDQGAFDRLTPLVYGELHRVARSCMNGGNPGNSLQPTALVNEAYLRLVDANGNRWQDRAHFFAVSAQMTHRLLVDGARAAERRKVAAGRRASA